MIALGLHIDKGAADKNRTRFKHFDYASRMRCYKLQMIGFEGGLTSSAKFMHDRAV
jgi:hypothetical protein